MSDKVTSLQDQLSLITNIMVDSVGLLQRDAPPARTQYQIDNDIGMVSDPNPQGRMTVEMVREHATEAGKRLVEACLKFEQMLDDLPTVINSQEKQMETLVDYQEKNELQTQVLKKRIDLAEEYLQIVSKSIEDITNDRLKVRHVNTSKTNNNSDNKMLE